MRAHFVWMTMATLSLMTAACGQDTSSNTTNTSNANNNCSAVSKVTCVQIVLDPVPANANLIINLPSGGGAGYRCPSAGNVCNYNADPTASTFDCSKLTFPLTGGGGTYQLTVNANDYAPATSSFTTQIDACGQFNQSPNSVSIPLTQ